MSRHLRLLSFLLPLATLLSLSTAVATFLLREVVATHLPNADVAAQLRRYHRDDALRARWDALQRGYGCCGGHGGGYNEWATDRGLLTRVPGKPFFISISKDYLYEVKRPSFLACGTKGVCSAIAFA